MRMAIGAALVLGLVCPAFAGQLYGTIYFENRPLTGAPVTLSCGGETGNGTTDGEGVYRVFVRATGGCMLVVDPGGRRATASVYSYDRPTAYDFDMVFRDGRWQLSLRK